MDYRWNRSWPKKKFNRSIRIDCWRRRRIVSPSSQSLHPAYLARSLLPLIFLYKSRMASRKNFRGVLNGKIEAVNYWKSAKGMDHSGNPHRGPFDSVGILSGLSKIFVSFVNKKSRCVKSVSVPGMTSFARFSKRRRMFIMRLVWGYCSVINQSINQTINRTRDRSTNQSISSSINQSNNRTINQFSKNLFFMNFSVL